MTQAVPPVQPGRRDFFTASQPESILVVDDDREVAAVILEYLEREGYPAAAVHDGRDALTRLRGSPVALVLLDLRLPDIDGLAVLREVQRQASPPEVVIVTGHATLSSAIEAVEAGAAGYVEKPVNLQRLGALVSRALERRRLKQENAALLSQVAERRREAEALHAITSTIISTLDVREALRRICREFARLFGADTVSAYLHDRAQDLLVPFAAYHVPREYLAALSAISLPLREQGFHLPLWQEQRPVWSDDVVRDPRFSHEAFRRFPHQSGLLLPLILDGEVAGAFYLVWWTERRGFTDDALALMEHLGGQVALFLRNAHLYEQAERDRKRLAVLNEVSRRLAEIHDADQMLLLIVNEAVSLLGAEAAALRLLEGDDLVLRARTDSARPLTRRERLKVGESLSGVVVATGEPLAVEDMVEDTRFDPVHQGAAVDLGLHGFLGVPLRARGRILGTLSVYARPRRRFMPDEVTLLSTFADQASLVIEKGRLLEETEEGRRLLERLYSMAISMQTSWSREDRLRAFVRGVRDVLDFDRVNVFLLTPDGTGLELATAEGGESVPPLTLPVSRAAGEFYQAFVSRRPVAVLSDVHFADILPLDPAYLTHPYLRTRRFVVAPLVIGDRVVGVASADNKPSRRPISPVSVDPFTLLCQQLATAIEEARLYADAQEREREAVLLYEVAREVSSSLELDRVLDLITAKAVEVLGCDASGIFVHDEAQGGLTYLRGRNLAPRPPETLVLAPGEGVVGRAFQQRRPVWTRDRFADPTLSYGTAAAALDAITETPPRAVLAVPMISRGDVHGVLAAHGFAPREFTPKEVRLLSILAQHAVVALDNARLYEEAERQRHRLAEIFDSTSDGMMLVSRDGQIVSANRRAGDLLAFDPARTSGLGLTGILAGHFPTARDYYGAVGSLQTLLDDPERGGEGDLELPLAGRTLHWVARPTRDLPGATGLTLTFQDVTQEREVSRMKSDFVSFVTHQLRTPLAGIKWLLELSAQSPGLADEAASYLADAREAAERLIGLVNDLLDVSRLESGKVAVTLKETDVAEVTRSVVDELGGLARDKGHRLTVHGERELPLAMADPQLLRQVVLNLTSNAIKYTPAGGEVSIHLGLDGGRLVWAVRDTGIGIPEEAQRRLFEKFYRAENVRTVETEGTGLGLYLVKLIVDRLGGRVWCESEEGKGSMFAFALPL